MSVEQLESQVLALPLTERRAFTRWLDEHRDEVEQPSLLARAQESEVRQRLAEMEADPGLRAPFSEADVENLFHREPLPTTPPPHPLADVVLHHRPRRERRDGDAAAH